MKIHVLKRHIKEAKKQLAAGGDRGRCCPVALAIKEHIKDDILLYVDHFHYTINKQLFFLTPELKDFVSAFDANDEVTPLAANIYIPQESRKKKGTSCTNKMTKNQQS